MKILVLLFCLLTAVPAATAQIELISGDYFPAELEFAELQKVTSEESFEDPGRLSKVADGALFADVGFVKYARRLYAAGDKGSVSIEIVTLLDMRAAYSLLTLLRTGPMQDGPPGDAFTTTADGIDFYQGKIWVRIKAAGSAGDLARRVATSVSNRIGPRRLKAPTLVSHFPKQGFDRSSLRYYPSVKTFESYSAKVGGRPLRAGADAEIAQAQYTLDNATGTLSLLSFPTKEVAEDYFSGLTGRQPGEKAGDKSYFKRAGPIVGILEGRFDAGTADKILRSIQYTYSVQWVYEKGNKPKTVWGVPTGILTTVVKSLFFVVLLFGCSILAGIGYALFRVFLKRRSPDQKDPDEITRLRMR
jgi:hypothetical protein